MSHRPAARPNVLLVISDDQRFDTVGALGNPHIHTPCLDFLVARGVSFAHNFCTTPICTPARAEILTGCNSYANQVPWFGMPINPELTLLPRAFQEAGYYTIHVGKWHNDGHPRDKGYDAVHCVFPEDNRNDYAVWGHHMRFEEGESVVVGHSTEVFTTAAIQALDRVPRNRPWLCYLAYTAPHDPHDSPDPFASLYDPAHMPLLPNFMPEHPFDNGDMVIRDELLEPWPRRQDAMRRYRCRYYGIISHLDHHLGRLLAWLGARGELDRTVVAFTGDQGLAIGSHGLLGKENMYDHSISAPLVFCGPGVPPGVRLDALVHHVDLLPTLCELAGIARPATAQHGFSLLPLMRGETRQVREDVLCQFYSPEEPTQELRHTQRALRTDRWKLTWYPLVGRYQLFDLQHDPHELVDLLAPWRCRRRWAEANGQPTWQPDRWASRQVSPSYTPAEIAAVVESLHQRLLERMAQNADPVLSSVCPPDPLGAVQ